MSRELPVLPMHEIGPECAVVLDARKRPLHYAELMTVALGRLKKTRSDVDWDHQIERVREKLLEARQFECFYVPAPHCLGARTSWFQTTQGRLNTDHLELGSGHLTPSVAGAVEALMRAPHMVQKNPRASQETIATVRARGLILQHHVTTWFRECWPAFYREADNHREWEAMSNHDFVLEVDGKRHRIDVVGASRTRGWDPPERKPSTDFHLLCELHEERNMVTWLGVVKGTDYSGKILPVYAISPLRMIVWLNCKSHGIDYEACARSAMLPKVRKRR